MASQPHTAPAWSARFPPEWFQRPSLAVCRELLGATLVHESPGGIPRAGRIVEVEAYLGARDRASHSFNGRETARNRAMFGPKGHAYIYLIYGMYWCVNVVTGPPGRPEAILIRAIEPVGPWAGAFPAKVRTALCRGPGKLCRALGIDGALYGEPLTASRLYIVPGARRRGETIARSPRINVAYAGADAARPWRFYLRGHPSVSGPAYSRK